MTTYTSPGSTPASIEGPAAWAQGLLWGLQTAQSNQARTLWCVDPDFSSWPLDDPAWLADLTALLRRPGRRVVMLAAEWNAVPRAHPRFTAWRRDWVHALDTRVPPPELATGLPSVLLDDGRLSVALLDPERLLGRASTEARTRWHWWQRLDAVLQRSEPGFPVTTLGL